MKQALKLFIILFSLYPIFGWAQESDATIIEKEADRLINNYQFDRALTLLTSTNDSLNINLLQRKGYCFYRLGNYEDAIAEFERIVKIDSTNRNALHQLGQLYSRNNQYTKSAGSYKKLISLDSLNSFHYKQYAAVASQADDIPTAVTNYLMTIKLNPRDIEAYGALTNVLLETEAYQMADSIVTIALSYYPESNQLRLLLAKAFLGEKKYQEVLDNVEELLIKSDTTQAHARLLGIAYFQLDQYEKVISCMNFLLKADAKADWIFYYIGASYQGLKNHEQAIKFLSRAIEEGISENISMYYTILAFNYEEVKDIKNAIRYYKAAYESSKSDILLYHLARNSDVYFKDKSVAIAYYKRYLKSDDTVKVAKEYSKYRLRELEVYR